MKESWQRKSATGRGWRCGCTSCGELFEEERRGNELLDFQPLAVLDQQEGSHSVAPAWVVERVMEFYHVVGLLCDGIEEKLVALFTDIEATRGQSGVGKVNDLSGRTGIRGTRELKCLVSFVNYDVTRGRSYRITGKGRGHRVCL